jgi:hypothetical protein
MGKAVQAFDRFLLDRGTTYRAERARVMRQVGGT